MLVDSIEMKRDKSEAMKNILRKTPLMSKINQFNRKIEDIHLEFIEYRILRFEVISKRKNKNNFRFDEFKDNIIVMVNTHNGHSQSVDCVPNTIKKYISRSCIKKSNIEEDYMIEKVKNEIISYIDKKNNNSMEKRIIKSIKLLETNSIYKPYWIGNYNGKEIGVDA